MHFPIRQEHTMPRLVLNLFAVVLLATVAMAGAAEKRKQRVVTGRITFSVDEYDPATPSQGVMRCELRNDSPFPWHVPVGFDGGYVKVKSGNLSLRRVTKSKDDVHLAWLEPGEQVVVFELPLQELLMDAGQRDAAWQWTWDLRPAPPRSPIRRGKEDRFVNEASFTATLDLGTYTLALEPSVLKVKGE